MTELKAREQKCDHCQWWKRIQDYESGNCYRFPPITNTHENSRFRWPISYQTEVCGEFKRSYESKRILEEQFGYDANKIKELDL